MPQLPIVVPVIVIGIMFGSLLKSEKPKISFKKVGLWALIAGALNAALAYADFLLAPAAPSFPTTGTGSAFRATFVSQTSEVAFSVASFLAAFLIVVVVFVIAAAYLRFRGGRAEGEEGLELTAEETSKLQPG